MAFDNDKLFQFARRVVVDSDFVKVFLEEGDVYAPDSLLLYYYKQGYHPLPYSELTRMYNRFANGRSISPMKIASSIAVLLDGRKIVFAHRSFDEFSHKGKLALFAGHLSPGYDLVSNALKELSEELLIYDSEKEILKVFDFERDLDAISDFVQEVYSLKVNDVEVLRRGKDYDFVVLDDMIKLRTYYEGKLVSEGYGYYLLDLGENLLDGVFVVNVRGVDLNRDLLIYNEMGGELATAIPIEYLPHVRKSYFAQYHYPIIEKIASKKEEILEKIKS